MSDVKKMVVSYKSGPLVIIEGTEYILPSDVLKWYSDAYAFDRKHLSYQFVDTVICNLSVSPKSTEESNDS